MDLTQFAILCFDIKNFKVINELFGSENGDLVLKSMFQMIRCSSLEPRLSARIESDHFAFLIKKENLETDVLEKLLHQKMELDGRSLKVDSVCGIYRIEDSQMETSRMLNNASFIMHDIVSDKMASYRFYNSDIKKNYIDQAEVLAHYEQAIANQEFKVYYQPIVHTETGKISSAEALIRWQRPNGDIIRPDIFIPTLEKNGCISKLDSYVGQKVYQLLRDRQVLKKSWVPIAVNLSRMDFYDKEFVTLLENQANRKSFERGTIRYEITETAYSSLEGENRTLLERLKQNGAEIILDDFGAGYSSFGMIKDYNFDVLKIDMSFVRQIVDNEKVRIIVDYIIKMCHKLKIRVVAEGVEREAEWKLLREMDCDYIQGYYFSKPLEESEFIKYMEAHI